MENKNAKMLGVNIFMDIAWVVTSQKTNNPIHLLLSGQCHFDGISHGMGGM